jgi:hypothetical protein
MTRSGQTAASRTTEKRLKEKANLNEGHGFSRAVKSLYMTALAAEVRFLDPSVVIKVFTRRFS